MALAVNMDDRGGSFVVVRRISQGLERGNTYYSTSGTFFFAHFLQLSLSRIYLVSLFLSLENSFSLSLFEWFFLYFILCFDFRGRGTTTSSPLMFYFIFKIFIFSFNFELKKGDNYTLPTCDLPLILSAYLWFKFWHFAHLWLSPFMCHVPTSPSPLL